MKIFIALFVMLACAGILVAQSPFDRTKPPKIDLGSAYNIAMMALGQNTNQFYCISAGLPIPKKPEPPKEEWVFVFCSTNSESRYVTVFFDGSFHVDDP